MNLLGAMAKYFEAKSKRDLPHREVSVDEFVRLVVATGADKKMARRQATICQALGSDVLVGQEWLSIKDDIVEPEPKKKQQEKKRRPGS